MIEDLSLHLADLVLNSLRAGARHVDILIAKKGEVLVLQVVDDGRGMSESQLQRALDPFFTTKDTPNGIGLGLALVQQTAEEVGGELVVDSAPGRGTRIRLSLPYLHPDRPPLGDVAGTLVPLMLSNPEVEFSLRLEDDHRTWRFTPGEIRAAQREVGPRALFVLEDKLREGLKTMGLKVLKAIMDELARRGIDDVIVTQTGERGLAAKEPIVEVHEGGRVTVYGEVDEALARRIVAEHVVNGRAISDRVLEVRT